MREYSPIRLIKQLKQVILKMLSIYNVKDIQKIVENQRYDLETLKEKPHVAAMRAVFELNSVVCDFEKQVLCGILEEKKKLILN